MSQVKTLATERDSAKAQFEKEDCAAKSLESLRKELSATQR